MEVGGARYRLLDTVRHYAQEKIGEAGGETSARGRHLAWYLHFVEQGRPKLYGAEQALWLARFDLERENLLAAHSWCDRVDIGEDAGLRLVNGLAPYVLRRGLLSLGYRVLVEALARPVAREPTITRSRALFGAGTFCVLMGRNEEALTHLEESLSIARARDDSQRIGQVLQPLARVKLAQGDLPSARAYCEEAVNLARRLGDRREEMTALNALAQIDRAGDLLASALERYESALALARDLADQESIAIGLLNVAMVSIGRGDSVIARAQLLEALSLARSLGSAPLCTNVLDVSAGLAAHLGEWTFAARLYGMAEAGAAQTGVRRDAADEAFLTPLMSRAREMLDLEGFNRALAEGLAHTSVEAAIADARAWLVSRA